MPLLFRSSACIMTPFIPLREAAAMDSPVAVQFERSGLLAGRNEVAIYTRTLVERTLGELGWSGASLSVLYCSDAHIRRLNREFRSLDEPTDILSFPAAADPEVLRGTGQPYLGDLAISLAYTSRSAKKLKRKLGDEVALLLVHGVLHLLGWDHDTAAREKRMWREQERLLALAADVRKPRIKPGAR